MSDNEIKLYRRAELAPEKGGRSRGNAHLVWHFETKDPRTGKRKRLSTGKTDEAEARVEAARILRDLAELTKPRDRRVTLRQAYESMIESVEAVRSSKTAKDYELYKRKTLGLAKEKRGKDGVRKNKDKDDPFTLPGHFHLDPDLPVSSLEASDLDKLRSKRRQAGNSMRTIGYELTVLRRAVLHAVAKMRSARPELVKWEVPQGARKTRFLSDDEMEALYAHLDPLRPITDKRKGTQYVAKGKLLEKRQLAYDVAVLLAWSGGRWSEVASLTWHQIDFKNEIITFYGSKTASTAENPLREVPLVGRAAEVLGRRFKTRKGPLVFPSVRTDEQMIDPPAGISTALNAIGCNHPSLVKQFGRATVHSLRHTFATTLRRGGVALDAIQPLLGHRSPAMTQRYAHINPDHVLNEARRALEKRHGGEPQ